MPRRFVFEDADYNIIRNNKIDTFVCPDCGFEFNADHVCDDELGGYECPSCEVNELTEKLKEQQQDIDRLKYWETDGKREITWYQNKARSLEQQNEDLMEYKKAYDSLRSTGFKLPYVVQSTKNI
ncbi:hypothetical protein [Metabacillus bambusae]|uniref:Uncharacterized protein n=1 Tax=Metabacillus bambusae TaxID=2795218 RepID=A0ABS3N4V1_9BACI|nr:hypothetical protein [Metabacillus bambusae]MBO1513244.1 hypothetical protein [Metabacillus bambusae]